MNRTEIEISDIKEIIVRSSESGKQIIVNGKEVDLSKLISMSIDIDCSGIRVNSKLFDYFLPTK